MNEIIMAQGIGQQFADIVGSGPLFLGILAALAAGLVSFASPCVVPLVPGYISYLAGVVGGDVEYTSGGTMVKTKRLQVGTAALLFILSLAGLSRHETAASGTVLGITGMAVALAATLIKAVGAGIEPLGLALLLPRHQLLLALGLRPHHEPLLRARLQEETAA